MATTIQSALHLFRLPKSPCPRPSLRRPQIIKTIKASYKNRETHSASPSIFISPITCTFASGLATLFYAYPALAEEVSSSSSTIAANVPAALIGAAIATVATISLTNNNSNKSEPPSPVPTTTPSTSPPPPSSISPPPPSSPSEIEDRLQKEFSIVKLEFESQISVLKNSKLNNERRIKELETALSQHSALLKEAEKTATMSRDALFQSQKDVEAARRVAADAQALSTAHTTTEETLRTVQEDNIRQAEELVQGRKEREALKFKIIDAERRASQAETAAGGAASAKEDLERQLKDIQKSLDRACMERAAFETQLNARDDQIENSYKDQNELLSRLELALEDAAAAKSLVTLERERNVTIEAARAAAVADARKLLAERRELSFSLEASKEEHETAKHALAEERLCRVAAEKALASSETRIQQLVTDLSIAADEASKLESALRVEHGRLLDLESDANLAAKDAKEALHREMEALAEVERQKEALEALKIQLAIAKKDAASAREEAEAARENLIAGGIQYKYYAGLYADELAPAEPKKKRGRPRKNTKPQETENPDMTASRVIDQTAMGLDEEEMSRRIIQAEAAVKEANQRSFQVRAEAVLLVETVEDFAMEAVQAAQAKVKILEAQLKKYEEDQTDA